MKFYDETKPLYLGIDAPEWKCKLAYYTPDVVNSAH